VRNGETGKMGYLKFCGSQQRFEEMTRDERNTFINLLKEEGGIRSKYD